MFEVFFILSNIFLGQEIR